MEILDIDVLVWSCFSLAPEEETFLGCHLFYGDVLDGETQDDGPDHTEGHLHVAVDDFWNGRAKFNTTYWNNSLRQK